MTRTASAKSIEFCHCFFINRNRFLKLLPKYQLDYERFSEIKDNINLYNDYTALNLQCFSCLKNDHVAKYCPNIHFAISSS